MIVTTYPFTYTNAISIDEEDMIVTATLPSAASASLTQLYRLTTTGELYFSDGSTWRAVSSANSIDQAPTSPHADNDEFNSTTLNPSWTETLENAPTISIHTAIPSHYVMFATTSSRSSILRKDITVAGDETWVAKFSATHTANFSSLSLGLFTSDLADGMFVDWVYNSAINIRLISMDSSTPTVRAQTNSLLVPYDCTMYLYMKRSSNTWSFAHSKDGNSWLQHTTTHAKTFTIAKLQIQLDSDSQTTPHQMSIDFVRRGAITL